MTTGIDGLQHTIVIHVIDPHSMESACPVGLNSCLAEGALSVEIDGEEALLTPGVISLAPDVAISAVNLPGACRYPPLSEGVVKWYVVSCWQYI